MIQNDYVRTYQTLMFNLKVARFEIETLKLAEKHLPSTSSLKGKALDTDIARTQSYVNKLEEQTKALERLLLDYGCTVEDSKTQIFVYLYIKGLKPKKVADILNLACGTVYNAKREFEQDLRELAESTSK